MKKSFPARALPLRCVFRARNLAILLLTLPQGTCCCCCARPSSGASKAVEGAARREQTEDGKTRLADVAPRRGARLPRPRPARSGRQHVGSSLARRLVGPFARLTRGQESCRFPRRLPPLKSAPAHVRPQLPAWRLGVASDDGLVLRAELEAQPPRRQVLADVRRARGAGDDRRTAREGPPKKEGGGAHAVTRRDLRDSAADARLVGGGAE